ncbi:hypothetical protein ABK040_008792 [Willaertia magna]
MESGNGNKALIPSPTSFHSGCLIHHPFHSFLSFNVCAEEEENFRNELFAFSLIERKWNLLFKHNVNIEEINEPPKTWGHASIYSPYNRSFYLFGGIKITDDYNSDLFRFDLQKRVWIKIKPINAKSTELPLGRQGHRMVYLPWCDSFILFGGYTDNDNHLNDFLKFDIVRNEWSKVKEESTLHSDRPSPREVFSIILNEKKRSIIIFGGKDLDERFNDMYEFSFITNQWKKIVVNSFVPKARSSHSAVFIEKLQKMIIFGGFEGENWLTDCYEFDFKGIVWKKVLLYGDPLPSKGVSSHIAFYDKFRSQMLVFGGWDGDNDKNDLYIFKIPTYDSLKMQYISFEIMLKKKKAFIDVNFVVGGE